MGQPAAVAGDRIQATCAAHQVPNPTSGIAQPGPPMPFSAPMTTGLAATVLVGGKPAAVVGSSGLNTPPHLGLHLSDPAFAPPAQIGIVVDGSKTVTIEKRPAARAGDPATVCLGLRIGAVVATSTVAIGG